MTYRELILMLNNMSDETKEKMVPIVKGLVQGSEHNFIVPFAGIVILPVGPFLPKESAAILYDIKSIIN